MVILGFSQLVAIGAAFVARQGKVHTVEVIKYKDPIIIEKQPDKQAKVAPIGKARSAEEILADMSSDSEDLDITSSRTSSTSVDTTANTAPSLPLNQRQSSSYFIEHPRVEELLNRAHKRKKHSLLILMNLPYMTNSLRSLKKCLCGKKPRTTT